VATSLAASERRDSTKDLYDTLLRVHVEPRLGTVRLDQLRPTHVEGLVADLRGAGKSTSTIRSVYTVLRQLLDTAVRDGLLARNPAATVQRPKAVHREVSAFDAAGVQVVLDAVAGHRLAPLLLVMAHAGLRRGEALALQWCDVDLEARRLHVRGSLRRVRGGGLVVSPPKTARSVRTVALTQQALEALRAHRAAQAAERLRAGSGWQDNGHVFTTEAGAPLDPSNVTKWVRSLGITDDHGRRIHPHVLRHSTATVLLEAGVPIPVVGELLGHSSYNVTADVYSHVLDRMRDSAAQVLSDAFGTPGRVVDGQGP
jgi:integrase